MIRRSHLLVIMVGVVVLTVAGGIYAYSILNSGPRAITLKELLASPTQYDGSQVKLRGELRVIYPQTGGQPQWFLSDGPNSAKLQFPASIWSSPPLVGEYIGKIVEIVGIAKTFTFGQQTGIVVEVQTMTLI